MFRPLLSLVLLLVVSSDAKADRHVAVKADADTSYVESREVPDGTKRVEKYVFLKGQFFEGAIRDKTLERTEITEGARALAPHLAKQNYLPTQETNDPDIVIAVHWGMTTSLQHNTDYVANMMERARDEQIANREFADAMYGSEQLDGGAPQPMGDFTQEMLRTSARQAAAAPNFEWARMASTRSERDISSRPMATVLGFSEVLNQDTKRAVSSEEARTIRHYLNEERYFVILMAYNLKHHENDKPMERLWVALLSIPAAGINFHKALERLGETGSDYFGTDQPGLKISRAPVKDHTGEVEIGEAIVVEYL
ncbi:MAG: hypothetical protein J6386_23215 [Candidatus Synoicihabitans palmerolidicus]|nr:hypothetical protein [Candidatus Synoicihabitans palmerolidicus]